VGKRRIKVKSYVKKKCLFKLEKGTFYNLRLLIAWSLCYPTLSIRIEGEFLFI
jgi:hypothetical protein